MKQPQEIEVWYILPAIRREFANIMVNEFKISQKNVAKILDVTESAVSQYLKLKRGKMVCFDKGIKVRIKSAVERIIKNNSTVIKEIFEICSLIKKSGMLCKIHKDCDNKVPNNCCVCLR